MTEISYFQKYSQRENHITNNTLLMCRHLYQHNTARFEKLLNSIIGDERLEIGLVFEQQVRADKSVPDGVVSQKPFNLYIEAKLDGKLDKDQILRHLQSAKDNDQSYIIGLTKETLTPSELSEYKNICADEGVVFAATTYTDLVSILKEQAKEFEADLIEIIDDYEQFLLSENMIMNPFRMISFPCGTSGDENVKHQVYYEPAHRPSKANVPFIGIYRNKQVTHIGMIKTAVIATCEDGALKIAKGESDIPDEYAQRVCAIIKSAIYYPELSQEPHRYYIFEETQEVNLQKVSPHGIQGKRYFDLKEDFCPSLNETMSMTEVADAIRGKSFT